MNKSFDRFLGQVFHAVSDLLQRVLGSHDRVASDLSDRRQRCPTIRRVRDPLDEPVSLEPVDRIRDTRRVHLEAFADLAQRQRAALGHTE